MRTVALLIIISSLSTLYSFAQPTLNARNMALGGGGTAYLTGPQAAFYNPANLQIRERNRKLIINFGTSSFFTQPVLNASNSADQIDVFRDQFRPGTELRSFQNRNEALELLADQFGSQRSSNENMSSFEFNWLGLNWTDERSSFGINVRSRGANRYRTGRNYYDMEGIEDGTTRFFQQSLRQQFQVLHEISFGYAESFEFLNGLTPNLDRFSFGIAPKLVLGGAYFDASYRSITTRQDANNLQQVESYDHYSSGSFTGATTELRSTGDAVSSVNNQLTSDLLSEINGIGAGLDVGLTYLVTFGSDLSTLPGSNEPTRRSLRLSFSITDIGFVRYNESPLNLALSSDTTSQIIDPPTSVSVFQGVPGTFFTFLEANGQSDIFAQSQPEDEKFSRLMPTTLHGGMLLEINRLKLMGDLSIGLTNNAFSSNKLLSHIGLELKPLPFWSLRTGTRFAINTPTLFSFGTGFEAPFFDLSFAAQFSEQTIDSGVFSGIAFSTLSFNF